MSIKSVMGCFVIMPFGEKPDIDGKLVDFDEIYDFIIKPVIENRLKMTCIRCDKIDNAGWIHKDMLEHIIFDDIVIVDITTLNPNVFYELGIRHALRPAITILIQKEGTTIPFNIRGLRIIDYDLSIGKANKAQDQIEKFIRNGIQNQQNDSIVYEVFPLLKVILPD